MWLTPFGGRCANHPQPCEDPPTDAGKFNHLRRVTVDSDGLVYGADFWGAGIEVFNPDTGASVRSIEGDEPAVPGFSEAYAVDVAPDGQVYVMDRLNHRIQRFSAAGTFQSSAGARGTQAGTFSWPEGLTVAPNGRVWALDTRGGRIENFPATLATSPAVKSYGSTGAGADQTNWPSNADVAADGVVWVADTRNDRLMRFNPATETWLTPVGSVGAAAGQLQDPMGVAVTADAVYVADTGNNRIQKLSLTGAPIASYNTGLSQPQGLEVAPDGSVWVADTKNNRLVHLSDTLVNLNDGFGGAGTGDHQFFDPHDLAIGNGKIYVADTYNNRVQVYDLPEAVEPPPAGQDKWSYSSQIFNAQGRAPLYPAGMAVASDDTWYVADSAGSRLVTVNPNTGTITPVGGAALDDPRDVMLDSTTADRLWVLNTGANRVLKLNPDGSNQGSPITGLNMPYGLDQDDTRLYVANTYAHEVKAYDKPVGGSAPVLAWNQTTCFGKAFSRPRDVAVADDGRIIVADTDNDRIVLLNTDGSCNDEFGAVGTGPTQFKSPRTVTSDGNDGMWVGDAFNYRIQHLEMDGASLGATPVDAFGSGADQFVSAHCVTAIPGTDDVAVCDTFNNRITVWDGSSTPNPTRIKTVGGTRPAAGGFNGPFGTAYGPAGELYVADWFNHRIQKFNANGTFAWERGNYGPRDGSLVFPRNIVVGGGQVFVADSENNRIDVFTPNGDFVRRIQNDGLKELSRPHQIALDGSGGFWVADTNNNRVVHMGSDGEELLAFNITGAATNSRPQGIAVDADGDILVSNSANNRVERFSATGTLLGNLPGTEGVVTPAGLQVTGTGADALTWVTDMGNNKVLVLDASGELVQALGTVGAGNGQLTQPRGVAVDPTDGDVAIADFGNNRVSVWKRAADVTCTTRTATHNASLVSGPAVLRYTLANVRLCTDGTTTSGGSVQATSVAPAAVNKAMAGLGMTFRLATKGAPKASTLSSGDARVQVSGSWSACVDLSYKSKALKAGVKSMRASAHGKLKQRLTNWSVKKIAKSKKIPTKVKHKIADRGMAKVLAKSKVKAGRATLQQLAADVVDRAFARAGRNGLRQLVAGTCLSNVWAPTITVTMKTDGSMSDGVSGTVRRLHVS